MNRRHEALSPIFLPSIDEQKRERVMPSEILETFEYQGQTVIICLEEDPSD